MLNSQYQVSEPFEHIWIFSSFTTCIQETGHRNITHTFKQSGFLSVVTGKNQIINQSVSQSIRQLINQSIRQLISQSIRQLINQSINQTINQSDNLSIN